MPCPCRRLPELSSVDKFLNEIGHDHSAPAVEMNAVGVKAPAIHLGNLIRTLVQHQNTESVTIKRKESEGRKGATRRFHDLRSHRFMNGNIVSTLFSCDLSDDCAVLFDAPVEC